jgi:hypothetical protein
VEFYSAFWPSLGPILLEVLQDSVRTGLLPRSCREGVLSLLFKKGARTSLSNYRPLTMLTSDYKLLSKIMARRLDAVIGGLVHPDQTGFIRGRNITSNLILLRSVSAHCARKRVSAAVVFLDQEKAFDRVHWQYRDLVLRHVGFGNLFRSMVSLLHTDIFTAVQVNNHLSRRFRVLRGTRQGDPFSPGLFALLEEPFACALRADVLFTGLARSDGRGVLKLSQYADDKAVYLSGDADAGRLDLHLRRYEAASGARVNAAKSHALALGVASPADFRSLVVPFLEQGVSTKYLGLLVGPDVSDSVIWKAALSRMLLVLSAWSKHNLSLTGKVTVLKTLATSTLWYTASVVPLPDDVALQLDRACWRFLWRDKKQGPVNRALCLSPKALGGLSMVDVQSSCSALQFKWLKQLFDGADSAWQSFLVDDLCSQALTSTWGLGLRSLLADPLPSASLLSPFWREILSTAHAVHLSEPDPLTFEEVLRQHLFFNGKILAKDGSSWTSRPGAKKTLAVARCTTVHDLVSGAGLARFSSVAQDVRQALPDPWQKLLYEGAAAPRSGDWFASSAKAPAEVLRVRVADDKAVQLDVAQVASDGSFVLPRSVLPARVIARQRFRLPRARVVGGPALFEFVGVVRKLPLEPDLLACDQARNGKVVRAPLSELTVRGTTAALLLRKAKVADLSVKWTKPLPWRRVWKWVWSGNRNRKVNDFLWKLCHRRLPLGEVRDYDPAAQGCRCGAGLETHEHLFFECPVAKAVWARFLRMWSTTTLSYFSAPPDAQSALFLSVPPSTVKPRRRAFWQLLSIAHTELLYSIWLQRCAATFNSEYFSPLTVFVLYRSRLDRALDVVPGLMRKPDFGALAASLRAASSTQP